VWYGVDFFVIKSSISASPEGCFLIRNSMRFIQYLKDTKGELKHVSWPTRRQSTYFTVLVIVLSLITAVFLGIFDTIFTKLLGLII